MKLRNTYIVCACVLLVCATTVFATGQQESQDDAATLLQMVETDGLDAAIEHYRKMRSDSADGFDADGAVLLTLAGSLSKNGKLEEAVQVLQLCTQYVPDSARAWSTLGGLQLGSGKLADAKASLQKALDINPHDIMSYYQWSTIYVFENYDKKVYQVPMRDGVALHTQVYTPKDHSVEYPIIYCRSPYTCFAYGEGLMSYFGLLGPGPKFIQEKYIFVVQDVRGRFMSEGQFEVMRPNTADWNDPSQIDESTDAYDSVEWMVNNVENFNGKVGLWGGSYLAYYAALALVNAHPAVTAMSLESPVAEGFLGDDYHHNGALHYAYSFVWLNGMGLAGTHTPTTERPDNTFTGEIDDFYSFFLGLGPVSNVNEKCFNNWIPFWNDIEAHGTNDEFWRSRSLGQYLKGINKPAVLVAGSWFDDQDLLGTFQTYHALEKQNPGMQNTLVMGCWDHNPWWQQKTGPWGDVGLPAGSEGDRYRDEILVSFFRYYLKGEGSFDMPEVFAFESGSNRTREYSQWPPANAVATPVYFDNGGSLSMVKPSTEGRESDSFVSDPDNPVPYYHKKVSGWTAKFMHSDQRFASERDDVLVYTGDVLTKDLTAAGPIEVDLYVSTTGTDADWVVKLIDVYPDDAGDLAGYQMLVRGDIMRGKFRNSLETPEPFVPGEVTHIHFTLPDINHSFRAGHRLMIQVQSTWFPLFDRNPQTFVDIYHANESDFRKATHTVYHSAGYPSRITLLVIPEKN